MSDPTYDKKQIVANPIWELAFTISEIVNDNAPLGWGRYIYTAKLLYDHYEIKRKAQT